MSRLHRFFDTLDHEGRAWEWVAALALLGMAFVMALPGDTLGYGIYSFLGAVGIGEPALTLIFGSVGGLHVIALIVNGVFRRTPEWRGAGSIVGFTIFGTLFILSLWEVLSPVGAMRSPGFINVFFALMALCDFKGIIRSGKDAAHVRTAQ